MGKTGKISRPQRGGIEQNGKIVLTEENWSGQAKKKQMSNPKLKSLQRTAAEKMRMTKLTARMSENKSGNREMNVVKSPKNGEIRKKIKSPMQTQS